MTEPVFRDDAYAQQIASVVTGHTPEGGILVDRSVFYPTGGGQPGDSGWVDWADGRLTIATAVKVEGGQIALVPAEPLAMPPVGTALTQRLDWGRRHRHMRMHTALHLLSVVIPLPVTGGQIGAERGRLDFDMPEPPADIDQLSRALNALIGRDVPVSNEWITDEDLRANPGLVKTMSVMPP
ncbi:MAG: alanyl-tRNA editing protein, partial [Paracoccaceae bacterium]